VNKIPPVARGLGKPNHVKSCVLPVFRFFLLFLVDYLCVVCLRLINWYLRAGFNTRTQIASRATQQQNHRRCRRCRSECAAEPLLLQNHRRRSVQIGAAVQCRSECVEKPLPEVLSPLLQNWFGQIWNQLYLVSHLVAWNDRRWEVPNWEVWWYQF